MLASRSSLLALSTEQCICPTDLNHSSMELWRQYADLAVFPGSLILDDDRTGDSAYPSSPLTPDHLKEEEPGLSDAACKAGARLYKSEGVLELPALYSGL